MLLSTSIVKQNYSFCKENGISIDRIVISIFVNFVFLWWNFISVAVAMKCVIVFCCLLLFHPHCHYNCGDFEYIFECCYTLKWSNWRKNKRKNYINKEIHPIDLNLNELMSLFCFIFNWKRPFDLRNKQYDKSMGMKIEIAQSHS